MLKVVAEEGESRVVIPGGVVARTLVEPFLLRRRQGGAKVRPAILHTHNGRSPSAIPMACASDSPSTRARPAQCPGAFVHRSRCGRFDSATSSSSRRSRGAAQPRRAMPRCERTTERMGSNPLLASTLLIERRTERAGSNLLLGSVVLARWTQDSRSTPPHQLTTPSALDTL